MHQLRKLLLLMLVCTAGHSKAEDGSYWVRVGGTIEEAFEASLKGDYATALRIYRPLAEQGNAKAQNILGGMYLVGNGVLQDYVQAAFWYYRAAEQGEPSAQENLAHCYWLGQGVPQDFVQAHKWFNLAAAKFGTSSSFPETFHRNEAAKNRDAVEARMTAAQVAEAQKLAREWRPKHEKAPILVPLETSPQYDAAALAAQKDGDKLYDEAIRLLQRGDYAAAAQAFKNFIERNPQSKLVGNAQYWLGESHYALRDYNSALSAFAEGYKIYKTSPKGPDNLLKLGITMAALGRKSDACAVFARISQDYPRATDLQKGRTERERQKNGCK